MPETTCTFTFVTNNITSGVSFWWTINLTLFSSKFRFASTCLLICSNCGSSFQISPCTSSCAIFSNKTIITNAFFWGSVPLFVSSTCYACSTIIIVASCTSTWCSIDGYCCIFFSTFCTGSTCSGSSFLV